MVSISKDFTSDTMLPERNLTQYLPFAKFSGTRKQLPTVSSERTEKLQLEVGLGKGRESSKIRLLAETHPPGDIEYGIQTALPTQTVGVTIPRSMRQPVWANNRPAERKTSVNVNRRILLVINLLRLGSVRIFY